MQTGRFRANQIRSAGNWIGSTIQISMRAVGSEANGLWVWIYSTCLIFYKMAWWIISPLSCDKKTLKLFQCLLVVLFVRRLYPSLCWPPSISLPIAVRLVWAKRWQQNPFTGAPSKSVRLFIARCNTISLFSSLSLSSLWPTRRCHLSSMHHGSVWYVLILYWTSH